MALPCSPRMRSGSLLLAGSSTHSRFVFSRFLVDGLPVALHLGAPLHVRVVARQRVRIIVATYHLDLVGAERHSRVGLGQLARDVGDACGQDWARRKRFSAWLGDA